MTRLTRFGSCCHLHHPRTAGRRHQPLLGHHPLLLLLIICIVLLLLLLLLCHQCCSILHKLGCEGRCRGGVIVQVSQRGEAATGGVIRVVHGPRQHT